MKFCPRFIIFFNGFLVAVVKFRRISTDLDCFYWARHNMKTEFIFFESLEILLKFWKISIAIRFVATFFKFFIEFIYTFCVSKSFYYTCPKISTMNSLLFFSDTAESLRSTLSLTCFVESRNIADGMTLLVSFEMLFFNPGHISSKASETIFRCASSFLGLSMTVPSMVGDFSTFFIQNGCVLIH